MAGCFETRLLGRAKASTPPLDDHRFHGWKEHSGYRALWLNHGYDINMTRCLHEADRTRRAEGINELEVAEMFKRAKEGRHISCFLGYRVVAR